MISRYLLYCFVGIFACSIIAFSWQLYKVNQCEEKTSEDLISNTKSFPHTYFLGDFQIGNKIRRFEDDRFGHSYITSIEINKIGPFEFYIIDYLQDFNGWRNPKYLAYKIDDKYVIADYFNNNPTNFDIDTQRWNLFLHDLDSTHSKLSNLSRNGITTKKDENKAGSKACPQLITPLSPALFLSSMITLLGYWYTKRIERKAIMKVSSLVNSTALSSIDVILEDSLQTNVELKKRINEEIEAKKLDEYRPFED